MYCVFARRDAVRCTKRTTFKCTKLHPVSCKLGMGAITGRDVRKPLSRGVSSALISVVGADFNLVALVHYVPHHQTNITTSGWPLPDGPSVKKLIAMAWGLLSDVVARGTVQIEMYLRQPGTWWGSYRQWGARRQWRR